MRGFELGGQTERVGVRRGAEHERDGVLRGRRRVAADRCRQGGLGGMPEKPIHRLRVAHVRTDRRQRYRMADGRLLEVCARRLVQDHRERKYCELLNKRLSVTSPLPTRRCSVVHASLSLRFTMRAYERSSNNKSYDDLYTILYIYHIPMSVTL